MLSALIRWEQGVRGAQKGKRAAKGGFGGRCRPKGADLGRASRDEGPARARPGRRARRVLGEGTWQTAFPAPVGRRLELAEWGGVAQRKAPEPWEPWEPGRPWARCGQWGGGYQRLQAGPGEQRSKRACGPCWEFAVFASEGGRRTEAFRAVGVSVAADVASTVLEVSPRRARCLRPGVGSRRWAHGLLLPRSSRGALGQVTSHFCASIFLPIKWVIEG